MIKSRLFKNPGNCPVTHTLNLIGGKWKPIILYCLCMGSLRFGKLSQLIPEISNKVLSNQLSELVADGLIVRFEYKEKPPRTEYALSELGETLVPIINALCQWGQAHAATELAGQMPMSDS